MFEIFLKACNFRNNWKGLAISVNTSVRRLRLHMVAPLLFYMEYFTCHVSFVNVIRHVCSWSYISHYLLQDQTTSTYRNLGNCLVVEQLEP